MARSLSELWKKGTTAPLSNDIPEGGLAIDVAGKKAYSRDSTGAIFEIGTTGAITEVEWGDITGDIPNQADLQAELDLKADDADLTDHIDDVANPHAVTAAQVGADPIGSADGVRSDLNAHIADVDNPHAVDKTDVGLGAVENIAPADMPISDDTQTALDLKANSADVYEIVDHIDESVGSGDAGKPIVLNGEGLVDVSMIDASTFYLVGAHDPSGGTEYPNTSGESPGAFWYVDVLSTPTNPGDPVEDHYYEFAAGELATKQIKIGDFMVWGAGGWGIMAGAMNPKLYYKLDGTQAITNDFAGGGYKLTNIAHGVADNDAITLGQVAPLLDDYVHINGDTMAGDLTIHGGTPAFILAGSDSVLSRVTDTGAALGIQTNRQDVIFSAVANGDLQGHLYVRRDGGHTFRMIDETDIEIGTY